MQNKQDKFVDWLSDKSDDFPFFQDLKEVEEPEDFTFEEMSVADFDISPDGDYNRA